jgi:hypothetical protein
MEDYATLLVVESMPKASMKPLKPSNSSTMNPKTTWNSSLESYHSYLVSQKVSKNSQIYCIYSTLSKQLYKNAILASLVL